MPTRSTISSDPAPAQHLRRLLAFRLARDAPWSDELFVLLAEVVLRGLAPGERRAGLAACERDGRDMSAARC